MRFHCLRRVPKDLGCNWVKTAASNIHCRNSLPTTWIILPLKRLDRQQCWKGPDPPPLTPKRGFVYWKGVSLTIVYFRHKLFNGGTNKELSRLSPRNVTLYFHIKNIPVLLILACSFNIEQYANKTPAFVLLHQPHARLKVGFRPV